MAIRWNRVAPKVKGTVKTFGRKFKKNHVDFLHESDVQAYLYAVLKKRFWGRVRVRGNEKMKTSQVHTEVHARGWGRTESGKPKSDVLDIVVIPEDDCVVLEKPKKLNESFGEGFYRAKLEDRDKCCGIEIKYNRYGLKNKKRGVKRYNHWKKHVLKDLKKLTAFRLGIFIFVSNIELGKTTRNQIQSDFKRFVQEQKSNPREWSNIKFFYCDPRVQRYFSP
ncbi:MAG: hypothetical protein AB1442_01195 [Nitrospirota bacterium]